MQIQGQILCPTVNNAPNNKRPEKTTRSVKGAIIIAIAGGARMENQIRRLKGGA
jgi:hypothetical protein